MAESIELGVVDETPAPETRGAAAYHWRRFVGYRAPLLVLLLVFVLGLAGGGAVSWLVLARQTERAAAIPPTPDLIVTVNDAVTTAEVANGIALLSAQVTVTNAGPAEVIVVGVSADGLGLTMTTDVEQPRWLQPGGGTPIDVTVRLECDADLQATVPTQVTLQTEEGDRGVVPAALDLAASGWVGAEAAFCRVVPGE